jgi:RNA polymerase sigma factor (sigma-70 family)
MKMEKTTSALAHISEEALLPKIRAGETALFEIIIRRNNAALYKVARCYGFNHQDAQDLMQETYITAFVKLDTFEGRSQFKTWITKILIHKCLYKLNHGSLKKEKPASEYITENAQPMLSSTTKMATEPAVLRREFSKVMEQALQEIPLPYKSVFMLRELEGFSVAETADLLAISPVNVKVRLNRAKALLQQKLEHYYSAADVFEFNLVYCDAMVERVFTQLYKLQQT